MTDETRQKIRLILEISTGNGEFVKLTLGKPTQSAGSLKNILMKPVMLKGNRNLSATYRYETRDEVKNFAVDQAISIISELIGNHFLSLHIFTTVADYQLVLNKKRKGEIKQVKPSFTVTTPLLHDIKARRLINTEGNRYLQRLGVTNASGQVLHHMSDKYRQINKYVEIFADLFPEIPAKNDLLIYDLGCGKGYLTFALYDYLKNQLSLPVSLIGIEIRSELVQFCNEVARECGFQNLNFIQGDIQSADIPEGAVMIALHACDTATDDAIYKGIRAKSPLIVCAPCCHKQVRREMKPAEKWNAIFRHGILFERQAEMLTDIIRSLLLQKHGYRTSIFEFISPEHTAKNLMLTASINRIKESEDADKKINDLKSEFGITRHYLEDLLNS